MKCLSNYHLRFQGYSEKAVSIATTICRQKRKQYNQSLYVGANELVSLLKNAEDYEDLILQIRKDQSAKLVYNLIEGNLSSAILNSADIEHPSLQYESEVDEDVSDLDENILQPSLSAATDSDDDDDIEFYSNEELW